MFVFPSKAGGQLSSLNPVVEVGTKTGRPAASPALRIKWTPTLVLFSFFCFVFLTCPLVQADVKWHKGVRVGAQRKGRKAKKNKTKKGGSSVVCYKSSCGAFSFFRSFMADGVSVRHGGETTRAGYMD